MLNEEEKITFSYKSSNTRASQGEVSYLNLHELWYREKTFNIGSRKNYKNSIIHGNTTEKYGLSQVSTSQTLSTTLVSKHA